LQAMGLTHGASPRGPKPSVMERGASARRARHVAPSSVHLRRASSPCAHHEGKARAQATSSGTTSTLELPSVRRT
jgi:hypothetical protein